jgi:hypothetical protein
MSTEEEDMKVIDTAIEQDDLDSAVLIIQDHIGQDDGGNASMFFSDMNEDDWTVMSKGRRRHRLSEYMKYEKDSEEFFR